VLDVVGSGCGALRCRVRAVLDVVGSGCGVLPSTSRTVTFTLLAPTTQRPTTATNHIQQNQRSTPHAVTYVLLS